MDKHQIPFSTIDNIWSAYRAHPGRDSQLHARLMLAYAPLAKYLAARLYAFDQSATVKTLPIALIALSRTIATWDGYHDGFLNHALAEVRSTVLAAIAEANPDN